MKFYYYLCWNLYKIKNVQLSSFELQTSHDGNLELKQSKHIKL
jgi:hypothetical protein